MIMPDHIHGIVRVGRTRSFAAFVRGFKSAVTSRVRQETIDEVRNVWQRGYHDRILREDDVIAARNYIAANPARWLL